jgi:16S rRNA (cytosine1402-N4)-methyltransferase
MSNSVHIPILVKSIVQALIEPFLNLQSEIPHWIVDCTLGGGGHTDAFLKAFSSDPRLQHHRVLALDQDFHAIERAQTRFKKELEEGRLEIRHCRFGEAEALVRERPVLGLMADLGFSSDQLEDASRGLSFQSPGPLDMRLDPTRGRSCYEILQQMPEKELADLLWDLGEERFSRRIASAIVSRRQKGELPNTTQGLVEIIVKAVPPHARHGRIHVATRTFQALRIFVNDELSELDHLMDHVIFKVKSGGRIAILSFHSLEDRKIKNSFKNNNEFFPLTKKPLQADEEEIRLNPRSRSAKLRIAERLR